MFFLKSLMVCCSCACLFHASALLTEERKSVSPIGSTLPFKPGEILIYEISWANIIEAGIGLLEVTRETTADGRQLLRFTAAVRSAGVVDGLYSIRYTIRSLVDPKSMQTLSYMLEMSQGARKKRRELIFMPSQGRVVSTVNNDPPETFAVPDGVQDSLSSLYCLRNLEDYTAGKKSVIKVHESGKNWTEQVQIAGRERVKTLAGEFFAIKLIVSPLYKEASMTIGEITIWLTDDYRRIPVLIKNKMSIGSIVITLKKAVCP